MTDGGADDSGDGNDDRGAEPDADADDGSALLFPSGWSLTLDPAAWRTDGGRVLIGGAPLRILRLTEAGARWLDRAVAGEPVSTADGPRRLARRLVDAGLAHPKPRPGDGPGADAVTVVVPVLNAAAGLARTLASVGGVGSVVVVDDGSDDADAIRRAAGDATVVRNDTPGGPGAARQRGWETASTPVVAFVDADVELPPQWLPSLLAHLGDPTVGAVAPRVMADARDGSGTPSWLARYERVRSPLDLGPLPAQVTPAGRVPYVPTATLVVRRDALVSIGGFDEQLRFGEDVDLVWRLHEAGWRVRYEPSVEVAHPSRSTLRAWARQRADYGTSAATLTRRHPGAVAPLRISGWSALAWAAVVAGRPDVGAGIAAATTAALVPKLRGLDHPVREAVRLAGMGNLWAGRSVADAIRRPWWPLAAALALALPSRPARRAMLAAAVVPALIEWRERRPDLDPVRYGALRLADDASYGTGVWLGCVRERSFAALRPAFTGPIPVSRTVSDRAPGPTPPAHRTGSRSSPPAPRH